MECHSRLKIQNTRDVLLTVIVEPWANEYQLSTGEECEVVATHPKAAPCFSLAIADDQLLVWIESGSEGGSNYQFWQGGEQID